MSPFVDRAKSREGSAQRRRFSIFLLGFLLVVGGAGTLLYLPTFGASYAYDDMDYLNLAADVLAGKTGYWEAVLRPHLEHFVPVLRMAFHASAAAFGYASLPFRLLVFLAHLGSAFWLSLLARRYAGSDAAGIATGLAYVLPAGFSSMWIWLMTGAGVPLGLFALTGALAAIGFQARIGPTRARGVAFAALAFSLACESTLAPLALGPALLDEYERRRAGRRGIVGVFAVSAILFAAAWVALSAFLIRQRTGPLSVSLSRGIPRSAFLVLVAPFRYLFPGLPLSRPEDAPRTAVVLGPIFGLIVAAMVAAIVLAVRRPSRELPRVAALTALGPLAVIGLVGLGRWRNTFIELFDADRYFFTLLTPIALLIGSVADDVREGIRGWSAGKRAAFAAIVLIGLTAEFLVHGSALRRRFPREVFDAHERRFRQLSLLAARLEEAAQRLPAGAPPLEIPDGNLTFPDVHNQRVSTRFLLHVAARDLRGVRLDGDRVGERDAALLNPVLTAWSAEIGEATPLFSVREGQVVDARESMADFRIHANPGRVVSGFYHWEGASRWMGQRGELKIVMRSGRLVFLLAAPIPAIQERHPEAMPLVVRVTLRQEGSEKSVHVGDLTILRDGLLAYRLDVPEPFASEARGKPVRLVLESARTWRPTDVLPGSLDPRDLSVQVFQAGFE